MYEIACLCIAVGLVIVLWVFSMKLTSGLVLLSNACRSLSLSAGQKTVSSSSQQGLENDWSSKPHSYIIGENYLIRTVTFHYTGKLSAVYDNELVLLQASWIADDGRYANAVKDGTYSEVEPYPDDTPVTVGRGSIVDAVVINHPLPREQK